MTVTFSPIKKNTANQVIYCSVFSQSTGQFQANPTIAAGDFQRSIDGGAFANMDNIPVVTPAAGKVIAITLSAAETNCDRLIIIGSDAAGAEWDDVFIPIEITPNPLEDLNTAISNLNTAIVAGIAANILAGSNVETTGTLVSGTYANTYLSNGSYWITAPVTPAVGGFGLNVYLGFTATASQQINSVTIRGYFNAGASRNCDVMAYNWVSLGWDKLSDSVTRMNNATTNQNYTYTLLSQHRKADGTIRIGFQSASTTVADRLNIDQCIVAVAVAGPSAADVADAVWLKTAALNYEGGITIDTIAGTAGTSIQVGNGTPQNPVLTYADAITLATNLGVKRLYLRPDSDITLTQNHDYWRFIGKGIVRLNGQSINDARFEGCELITGTSTGNDADFSDCTIGDVTVGTSLFMNCALIGTVTAGSTGNYTFHHCYDSNPGTGATPQFTFIANAHLGMRDCQGGMQLGAMGATNEAKIDGRGRIVILNGCTGGEITIRGDYPAPTDQVVPGPFAGTIVQTQRFGTDQSLAGITGDVSGKVIGGGASTITGTGARVVDSSGNAVAPASIFTGITVLANWLRGLARKDAMNATAKTELNTGGGAYNEATDSLEANVDTLQPANVTEIAGAAVNTALAQVGVNVVTQANIDFGALQKSSLNAATPTVTVGTNNDKTGYGLADDAITSAKFDESTAFPVKSADTGATLLARTGADADTLKTLSDQLDTILADTTSLNDTVLAEITSATDIPITPTIRQAIMLVYMWLRNNTQATTTARSVVNNAGTEILKATMADSGTVFSQGKLGNP